MADWDVVSEQAPQAGGWDVVNHQEQPGMLSSANHTLGETLYAVPEAITNLASRAIAGTAALGAGAAGSILPGEEGQARRFAQKTQEMLPAYEPRGRQGKVLVDLADVIPNFLSWLAEKAGHGVADVTGSPTAGAVTEGALQAAPSLIARGTRPLVEKNLATAAAEEVGSATRESIKDRAWNDARKEGFVAPPSAVEPSFISNRGESLGGKAAINQQAAITNQEVANKLGRRAAGLGPDEPLTDANLAAARAKLAAPYDEISALSLNAKQAWDITRESRRLANLEWKHYNASQDPAVMLKAQKLEADAAFFEQFIEAEAKNLGRPDLIDRLRTARMKLAQNYDVQRAVNTGDVSLRDIAKVYEEKGDKGMTGDLAVMARFANTFYKYTQEGAKVQPPGVSKVEMLASLGLGGGGYAAAGWPGVAAAALPWMSHAARPLMLSKAMQRTRDYGPGTGLKVADQLTANPYAWAVPATIGLKPESDH